MPELFRFETNFAPFAIEAGMGSIEVTVSLWCGEVLLDQRTSSDFLETDEEVKKAIKDLTEEISSRFGYAIRDFLRKEGWTL